MEEKETLAPVVIPMSSLKEDILEGIMKDFILREGTDYGMEDFTLEQKLAQVRKLLSSGKAGIYFDPNTESCTILDSAQIKKLKL